MILIYVTKQLIDYILGYMTLLMKPLKRKDICIRSSMFSLLTIKHADTFNSSIPDTTIVIPLHPGISLFLILAFSVFIFYFTPITIFLIKYPIFMHILTYIALFLIVSSFNIAYADQIKHNGHKFYIEKTPEEIPHHTDIKYTYNDVPTSGIKHTYGGVTITEYPPNTSTPKKILPYVDHTSPHEELKPNAVRIIDENGLIAGIKTSLINTNFQSSVKPYFPHERSLPTIFQNTPTPFNITPSKAIDINSFNIIYIVKDIKQDLIERKVGDITKPTLNTMYLSNPQTLANKYIHIPPLSYTESVQTGYLFVKRSFLYKNWDLYSDDKHHINIFIKKLHKLYITNTLNKKDFTNNATLAHLFTSCKTYSKILVTQHSMPLADQWIHDHPQTYTKMFYNNMATLANQTKKK